MKWLRLFALAAGACLAGALGRAGEIHDAARAGDCDRITALLELNPQLVQARDASGLTPLHCAAARGQGAAVELLLARQAEANARDNTGSTPLHHAAYFSGREPLEANPYLAGPALEKVRAEYQRQVEVVRLLLAHQADAQARDDAGDSPLLWAAMRGNAAIVELLLEHGAAIDAPDDAHRATPLHMAVRGGHRAVTELLLARGADVKVRDKEGKTPLGWAVAENRKELAELLRQHGAVE